MFPSTGWHVVCFLQQADMWCVSLNKSTCSMFTSTFARTVVAHNDTMNHFGFSCKSRDCYTIFWACTTIRIRSTLVWEWTWIMMLLEEKTTTFTRKWLAIFNINKIIILNSSCKSFCSCDRSFWSIRIVFQIRLHFIQQPTYLL